MAIERRAEDANESLAARAELGRRRLCNTDMLRFTIDREHHARVPELQDELFCLRPAYHVVRIDLGAIVVREWRPTEPNLFPSVHCLLTYCVLKEKERHRR